jgi:hypothetical protein
MSVIKKGMLADNERYAARWIAEISDGNRPMAEEFMPLKVAQGARARSSRQRTKN